MLLPYEHSLQTDKYGIEFLMLFESKTFYMLNFIIYIGKNYTPMGIPVVEYSAFELCKTQTEI